MNNSIANFIDVYEPGGTMGINGEHAPGYERSSPYFDLAAKYMPPSQNSNKLYFNKFEHCEYLALREPNCTARKRRDPAASLSNCLFLGFAKAFFNVICLYKNRRSPPKETWVALIVLEKALRIQYQGNNDPSGINHQTFAVASSLVQGSLYSTGKQYDIGRELEMIAGMLQSGFNSKTFRYSGRGFRLLPELFDFRSSINQPPRLSSLRATSDFDPNKRHEKHLSDEVLQCVGKAYQRAFESTPRKPNVCFAAASLTLGFVAASMRSSELAFLRRDAIYSAHEPELRLRIYRAKIDEHQDLPIPAALCDLTKEAFRHVSQLSHEAHLAFDFYVSRYDTFPDVDDLFIPARHQTILSRDFLTFAEVRSLLGLEGAKYLHQVPNVLAGSDVFKFVNVPSDLSSLSSDYDGQPTLPLKDAIALCKRAGYEVSVPGGADLSKRITVGAFERYLGKPTRSKHQFLRVTFARGSKVQTWFSTKQIKARLLADFKKSAFPHWPFVSKERVTRLNESLMVNFKTANHEFVSHASQVHFWWRPVFFAARMLSRWITSENPKVPPALFSELDVRLSDGSFPSVSIEDARKYHQTKALLAGISRAFLDSLAGRKSGRQSEHYDWRTPLEQLESLSEKLDLGAPLSVVGPVADVAHRHIKIVDRKSFLIESAAPKHMTLHGGCRSDWSINPCEHYGDCLRCDGQVWIKGDSRRLPKIANIAEVSQQTIAIGTVKLEKNPRRTTIATQVHQAGEALKRCEEIFEVERNLEIPDGTVVTFSKPGTSMGIGVRHAYIRHQEG